MPRVMTMGSFDLFHAGHASLIRACIDIAGSPDNVTVGVNSDAFMEEYKRKPIIPCLERRSIIESFNVEVFEVRQHDASSYLKYYEPDFLVIGEDWAHKDYYTQLGIDQDFLNVQGITLLYKAIDYPRTTTQTIEEIKTRD